MSTQIARRRKNNNVFNDIFAFFVGKIILNGCRINKIQFNATYTRKNEKIK